ncbi:hypothetical protein Aperf_G00000001155 [Anoplocephala perfoliata]
MDAVFANAYNVAAVLLSRGAAPYITFNGDGSPLHYAAVFGYLGLVRLLIKYGADCNSLNKAGYIPLLLAIKFNKVDLARYLIESGASLYPPLGRCDETALTFACFEGSHQLAKLISTQLSDVEDRSRELYIAVSRASLKAKVNDMYENAIPPLFAAIYGRKIHAVKLLISNNADIELCNRAGYTPLMEAVKRGYFGMVKALLEVGANLADVSSFDEQTASDLAESGEFREISSTKYPTELVRLPEPSMDKYIA